MRNQFLQNPQKIRLIAMSFKIDGLRSGSQFWEGLRYIMSWAPKSSFKTGLQMSLEINHIETLIFFPQTWFSPFRPKIAQFWIEPQFNWATCAQLHTANDSPHPPHSVSFYRYLSLNFDSALGQPKETTSLGDPLSKSYILQREKETGGIGPIVKFRWSLTYVVLGLTR